MGNVGRSKQSWSWAPEAPPFSCVDLGKPLSLSEAWLPSLWSWNNHSYNRVVMIFEGVKFLAHNSCSINTMHSASSSWAPAVSTRAPWELRSLCLPNCDTPPFSPMLGSFPRNTFQKKDQNDQDSRDQSLFLNFRMTIWVVITGSWACWRQL